MNLYESKIEDILSMLKRNRVNISFGPNTNLDKFILAIDEECFVFNTKKDALNALKLSQKINI